jgi:hypothetical protein
MVNSVPGLFRNRPGDFKHLSEIRPPLAGDSQASSLALTLRFHTLPSDAYIPGHVNHVIDPARHLEPQSSMEFWNRGKQGSAKFIPAQKKHRPATKRATRGTLHGPTRLHRGDRHPASGRRTGRAARRRLGLPQAERRPGPLHRRDHGLVAPQHDAAGRQGVRDRPQVRHVGRTQIFEGHLRHHRRRGLEQPDARQLARLLRPAARSRPEHRLAHHQPTGRRIA